MPQRFDELTQSSGDAGHMRPGGGGVGGQIRVLSETKRRGPRAGVGAARLGNDLRPSTICLLMNASSRTPLPRRDDGARLSLEARPRAPLSNPPPPAPS